jgi:hypothetical protein
MSGYSVPYKLCALEFDGQIDWRWLPENACRADGTVSVDIHNDGHLWSVTEVFSQTMTRDQLIALKILD